MRRPVSFSLLTLALAAIAVPVAGGQAASGAPVGDPSVVGQYSALFAENNVTNPKNACHPTTPGHSVCTPAAASVMVLPNGKILYWDALEGMQDVTYSVVAQFGDKAVDDQSRVLNLSTLTWTAPTDATGGANLNGYGQEHYLPLVPHYQTNRAAGDLFCSDQIFLANGDVLDAGGTDYYNEPGTALPQPLGPTGVVELEGLKNTRIYDPQTNTFTQTSMMHFGRWYPSLVTLANGNVFVASGVTKLIKPVYTDSADLTDSGTNVKQTEQFDPTTRTWAINGGAPNPLTGARSADKSLPLFPRLHLLPDGHVYYDAGGQTFNPDGQSYDEATWGEAASYDPASQTWQNLGIPNFGVESTGIAIPEGFRGSAFDQMLPLTAPYASASFLSAGGVLGVSPGSYLATDSSTIDTVNTHGGQESFSSTPTAPLHTPRWYGAAVTLPTGQVVTVSGADRDEVVLPGSGTPNTTTEWFDPSTKTWSVLASQAHGRTYHNSAVLLPDATVLVGGHAPIATGYAFPTDALHNTLGFSAPERDPSFQIFSPPNLFYGPRPVIVAAPPTVTLGQSYSFELSSPADAAAVAARGSVALVRNTAYTHLVDGDQRTVDLPVTGVHDAVITVAVTANQAVLPAGPYMLFANKPTAKGLTPSVSRQVFVGTPISPLLQQQILTRDAALTASERVTSASTTTPTATATGVHANGAPAGSPVAGTAGVGDANAAQPAHSVGVTRTAVTEQRQGRHLAETLAALALFGVAWGTLLGRRRRSVRSG